MGDQSKRSLNEKKGLNFFNAELGKNLTVTMFWVAVCLFSSILTAHGKATHGNVAKRLNGDAGNNIFQVQGKTYVFINKKVTWENARAACQDLSGDIMVEGDLASIPLYKDIDLIAQKLEANGCKTMWVGFKWKEGAREFQDKWFWLTEEPLPFNHARWKDEAEPSTTAAEKYGLMNNGQLWTANNDYGSFC